jgi:hypothetical protein
VAHPDTPPNNKGFDAKTIANMSDDGVSALLGKAKKSELRALMGDRHFSANTSKKYLCRKSSSMLLFACPPDFISMSTWTSRRRMPRYKVEATVAAGPTNADLIIDGEDVIVDDLKGEAIITSDKDPLPYTYEATGTAGFPADLTVVLTPLPAGAPINFTKKYVIPGGDLLSDDDGTIPIKKAGNSQ